MSRIDEVNELIKQEISRALNELGDPRIGFVTVLKAETTKDLRRAFVSVSIYNENKKLSFETLNKRAKEIQVMASKNMTMKFTPRIEFILDENAEYADMIDRKLRELKKEDE